MKDGWNISSPTTAPPRCSEAPEELMWVLQQQQMLSGLVWVSVVGQSTMAVRSYTNPICCRICVVVSADARTKMS